MNVYFSTYLARFSSATLCGLQCGQHFQLRLAKSRKWQHNEMYVQIWKKSHMHFL